MERNTMFGEHMKDELLRSLTVDFILFYFLSFFLIFYF